MVMKMSEKGSYLYPKRQSEGTWIESKCQISSIRQQSQGEGTLARVLAWIDDVEEDVGHRRVREEAKGGAPLVGGAHNTSQGSNKWQKERGGVSYERGA
jgi:hypothetical protein